MTTFRLEERKSEYWSLKQFATDVVRLTEAKIGELRDTVANCFSDQYSDFLSSNLKVVINE
jgi:hypothetical protein